MANRLDPNTPADSQVVGTIDDLDPSWSVMSNGAFLYWGQTDDSLTIVPDPLISLESGTVAEAIDELAEDIHDNENMPSLSASYNSQRTA